MAALEGSTAVINLVGRSVNCRYTESNKNEIIASRVNATRILGYAIKVISAAAESMDQYWFCCYFRRYG
jgi:NAD dependent epimerase/dehydratase family enzyme